jgi:hypothetical protein
MDNERTIGAELRMIVSAIARSQILLPRHARPDNESPLPRDYEQIDVSVLRWIASHDAQCGGD